MIHYSLTPLVHWLIESLAHSCIGHWVIDSLNHRFMDSSVHCFIDSLNHCWLIGSSTRYFIRSLIHWLIGPLVHRLTKPSMHGFIDFIVSLNHRFTGSLFHWIIGSLIQWFVDSLIHWFIDSLASQPPFAHSLMDLSTSTAYGFCISKMFLQAIDSYSHFLCSKLPPRGWPGTICYVYSNPQYDTNGVWKWWINPKSWSVSFREKDESNKIKKTKTCGSLFSQKKKTKVGELPKQSKM